MGTRPGLVGSWKMGVKAEMWSGPVEGSDELLLGNPFPGLLFLMHRPPLAAGGTISLWSVNLP